MGVLNRRKVYGIIYKIENKMNGMVYIGQTKRNLKDRIYVHSKSNSHIGHAIKKYGLDVFIISIIDRAASKELLSEKEIYWIKTLNCRSPNGYNATSGGEGGIDFHIEETKNKIRKSLTGRPRPEEVKQRMRHPKSEEGRAAIAASNQRPEKRKKQSDARIGTHPSEEAREKMRKPKSEEHNRKNSESHKGIKQSKEHIEKRRKSMIGKNKGKIHSEATIQKQRESHIGKKQSKETIEKRNQSIAIYWEKVHSGLIQDSRCKNSNQPIPTSTVLNKGERNGHFKFGDPPRWYDNG